MKRRHFLRCAALAFGAAGVRSARAIDFGSAPYPIPLFSPGEYQRIDSAERVFHRSTGPRVVVEDPEQVEAWRDAGVKHLWLTLFHISQLPKFWNILTFWKFS